METVRAAASRPSLPALPFTLRCGPPRPGDVFRGDESIEPGMNDMLRALEEHE
jgi:hypothetical protein